MPLSPSARRSIPFALVFVALAVTTMGYVSAAGEFCDGLDNDFDGTTDPNCPQVCDAPRSAGPQIPVSDAGVTAQLGRHRALVWTGSGYAAVWSEKVGQDQQVFLTRMGIDGSRIGDLVPVSAVDAINENSALSWSGGGYGVVWNDTDFGIERIRFAFVEPQGAVTAGPVIVSANGRQGARPAVIWDGSAFIVTWSRDGRDVMMRRVAEDGSLLGVEACVTCGAHVGVREVAVTTGPGGVGHAWSNNDGGVFFVRSDSDGNRLGGVHEFTSAAGADHPDILFGAGSYALAWSDRRDGDEGIYFARMDTGGAQIGTDLRVNAAEENSWRPSLAWTGSHFIVGWTGGPSPFSSGVYLQRLQPNGSLEGTSLFVEGGSGPYMRSSLVWTGSRPSILRDEEEFGTPREIKMQHFDCCGDPDGDGVSWCDGDLDEGNSQAFPGAVEICDGRDNDQDGTLDEGCDRSCEAANLGGSDYQARSENDVRIAMDLDGAAARAFLTRSRSPIAGEYNLMLERGPAFVGDALENDPALSVDSAVAWTGERAAVAFRDQRGGADGLRFAAQDGMGTTLVPDRTLDLSAAQRALTTMTWEGRNLALGWVQAESADGLRFTLLGREGGRLLEGQSLADVPVGMNMTSMVAVEISLDGGVVLAYLDEQAAGQAVVVEKRDGYGGSVVAPVEAASAVAGRRDIAIIDTGSGYLAAWSGLEGVGGRREIVTLSLDRQLQPTASPQVLTESTGAPLSPSLVFTGAEVLCIFADSRTGVSGIYSTRLTPTGARLEADRFLREAPDLEMVRARWNGENIRIAWSVSTGTCCDHHSAVLDCTPAQGADYVTGLIFIDDTTMEWDAQAGAVYDVVSGNLAALAASGDFSTAVDSCEAANLATSSHTLNDGAVTRFYLVRAEIGASVGSYDTGSAGQGASRDAGITASGSDCP